MILVTGATGKIGSRVVGLLTDRGVPTRAQVRSPERAEVVSPGAEVVVAPFEDREALDAAVSGCSAVLLLSPPGPDQRAQEGAVIDAVGRSGTGAHVVKVAALGLGDPAGGRIAVQHGEIRDDLVASGLPWTVLALSQLMHNVLLYTAPILELGVLPVPAGDGLVAWVDADDVAAVAAAALTSSGHEGATYDVTGPEALHHREVAALLTQALGREVAYVDVPPADAEAGMVAAGVPAWVAGGVVETNGFYAKGGAERTTDVVSSVGGVTPTTMAGFLAVVAPSLMPIRQP